MSTPETTPTTAPGTTPDAAATPAARRPRPLTTRYLMTCGAIGAATGVLLIPVNLVAFGALAAAPTLVAALVGFWLVGGVIALALLQRPGAALITSVISGIFAIPTPAGLTAVLTMAMVGVALELGFAVTLYRVWSPWLFYVSTAVIAAVYLTMVFPAYEMGSASTLAQVMFVLTLFVSMVGAAWLGLLLARRLAATGVTRGLAPVRRPAATTATTTTAP
ncbi:energy-coupling factor transport system substrate-specific component [Sediminihabitans luteus]|uniref:Energy-coupling factor transport system substrate-specific component n=1 Tax=Sediminihabitans luteus TaxID=1138585 RepID=A0A2M9CPQ1_9CELL|nr:ECF transporter S component [Sediminihabitans luteus]PJJ73882.1 energy-coupling factor transport system substrate-specific component [Sediminihabitans luteus]GII98206.1 ABC transporter permease [Sediminihabitans luteus]